MIQALLRHPAIYDAFQHLAGGYRARRVYVDRHIRPREGQRVLDIGCGTGEMLGYFPRTTYVGIDPSADYIRAASERFGDRGTFICSTGADGVEIPHWGEFDVVHSTGVLHHLDDDDARRLIAMSRDAMGEGGRFFTLDGCLMPTNNRIENLFLGLDRGKFMRSEAGYVGLARTAYPQVASHTYRRLFFPLPYPSVVLDCGT